MMLRRHVGKVVSIGLTLVIAYHLFLVFYKITLQKWILVSVQKDLYLLLSEWDGIVTKRLSHLELDLQHPLKESMKLGAKEQENMDNTLERVKDEQHPVGKAVEAKATETKKNKPREKLFPGPLLFKQWGEDLSEAQQKKAQDLFQQFGYNVYLSDQLPLNRSIPGAHHSRCLQKTYPSQLLSLNVILTFTNEALSSIQWAIARIISWIPSRLLKEIILMDDFSSNGELKANLDKNIKLYNQKYPLLKIVQHTRRKGLAQAHNTGWEVATADVVAILDAHVEVNVGWAEPILAWIQEDHTMIVSPVFDNIYCDTFELTKYELAVDGFNWELWCHYDLLPKAWVDLNDVTAPLKSHSIAGILAADRFFLGKIGSMDGGMLVYGGDRVELSLRKACVNLGNYKFCKPYLLHQEPSMAWQCGGRTEVLPCSWIAHLERHYRPYALHLISALKHNAVRLAKIMDVKSGWMVYMAWNTPLQNSGIDYGDIFSRMALREKVKCRTFDWYLKSYPALKPIHNIMGYGRMKNLLDEHICRDQGLIPGNTPIMYYCNVYYSQNVYYHLTRELSVGQLIAKTDVDDHCLTDSGSGRKSTLEPHSKAAKNRLHIYWDFKTLLEAACIPQLRVSGGWSNLFHMASLCH
ncbi:LOW QUALITY PROTEIN: putative polypeptide N-acetylgalactosaminyltransferase 8 [Glossophaga mutica]